ncbi:MAG: hypothetical protein ACYC2I_10760 [Elusimicrobiales bacterium]
MNIIFKSISLCAALALPAAASAASGYAALSEKLARAAEAGGVTRITVGGFSSEGEGSSGEASFAAEKISHALAGLGGLQVSDQAVLELNAGGGAGWLKKLPSKLRPQALVRGAVFVEDGRVTVMAKLVDAASGRVLASAEMKAEPRFSALPPVPELDWGTPPSAAAMPDPFRDAPADDGFDCQGAFKNMDRLNEKAVDMKARYWAAKLKEPGFVPGSLTRNPGSEIRNPLLKDQFYELLKRYYGLEEVPALPSAQLKQLEAFMDRESGVLDRCGSK